MKFLKNIFGSKQNKKSKFKSNTLAEANGSPDLRLATAKEKESDVPVLKKEEVKKTPKKATSAAASGTKNTADKVKKVEIEEVKSSEIVPTEAIKTANDQSASEQKKATTDKKSGTQKKDNEGKVEVKKAPKKSETEVKAATTTVDIQVVVKRIIGNADIQILEGGGAHHTQVTRSGQIELQRHIRGLTLHNDAICMLCVGTKVLRISSFGKTLICIISYKYKLCHRIGILIQPLGRQGITGSSICVIDGLCSLRF